MRRRKARESVLQILYGLEADLNSEVEVTADDITIQLKLHYQHFSSIESVDADFVHSLLSGTISRFAHFNDMIRKQSEHWRLERMALVDRNILRFAIYELEFFDDVPNSVTINEAVEIAKRYGTDESGSFINGILDQIWKHLPKNPKKIQH